MEIGAQLFTLRDYCKTLPDFAETLTKVADIGYKTVQVSGVCPYEPEWLAEQLKKTGNNAAYEQVMVAVSDFETGNLRLSAVMNSLEV
jgi:sugar phosphate isomerase/epimerase